MKLISKPALAAGIAMAVASAPACAQVNGIAVTDIAVAVASTQSLQTGLQQIGTTYAAQITQLEQLETQRQQLLQTLDTNGDGQIDEAEQATLTETNPTVQQVGQIDQQIAQAQTPLQLARIYVVSQVAAQYSAALQQVISDRNIQIVLSPEAVAYAPEAADITEAVATALYARVPTVNIVPPQGWQPSQAAMQLNQQVQQVFAIARAQQQAAQQAQGAAAPNAAGSPVTAPEGR
ncbi:MAG TPA: OmpH family outer membrane protein [Sphingomonadaceae bacterium]|nr:OmpH family outer membrane protein [Sphingomonadaceae bacterium]